MNMVVLERHSLPPCLCACSIGASVGVLGRLTRSIRKALKVKEGLQTFLDDPLCASCSLGTSVTAFSGSSQ